MIAALIDGALKRRKVVLAVTVIAGLFGFFAYMAMPREANPDIPVPFVGVTVPYPGVSPEDAERLLVRPLERDMFRLGADEAYAEGFAAGAASVTRS